VTLLTDDQKMLRETAAHLMAAEGSIAKQMRPLRDKGCSDGFGHDLWRQFGELGLAGMCAPEAQGGLGMGATEAALVLEEIGRNLTPSPFLTTSVAAVRALDGSAQAERWFPGIVAGETVAALAMDEGRRHAPGPHRDAGRAAGQWFRAERGQAICRPWRLGGRHSGRGRGPRGRRGEWDGLTLFAVARDSTGLGIENVALADSSKAARLTFDNVSLDGDAVIGEVDGGSGPLSRALNAGRAGAAAELVGVAAGASAMTPRLPQAAHAIWQIDRRVPGATAPRRASVRRDRDRRAAAFKAAELLDGGDAKSELMVSVAKAKAISAAALAVQEGVQMHGGIGMTDEHDIGFFMKREAVLAESFGDARFHRARVAELSGY
jgi:alkylation response protein AidB-like acyl-CoA dehydrogenase